MSIKKNIVIVFSLVMAIMGCPAMAQGQAHSDAQETSQRLDDYLLSAKNAYKLNGFVLVAIERTINCKE